MSKARRQTMLRRSDRHDGDEAALRRPAARAPRRGGERQRPRRRVDAVTWNREISRLVYDQCASCHRPGGTSFSLMTYADAQPRGNEIKDAVLARRMPPWGAVKGFGNFRNDQSLMQEQIELIARWVDGGHPARQQSPAAAKGADVYGRHAGACDSSPGWRSAVRRRCASRSCSTGCCPQRVPAGGRCGSSRVLPGGSVEPLVWLHGYDSRFAHPFLFRQPLTLPAGTVIRGVPRRRRDRAAYASRKPLA